MNKKQKKNLIRIIIAAVLLIGLKGAQHAAGLQGGLASMFPGMSPVAENLVWLVLFMVPYLIVGYDILIKAAKGIRNRQPMDECLLMAIATLGAIVLAVTEGGDFTEAIAVMLFYQIGEWFQSYAVDRSRKNVAALMDICPEYANLEREDGSLEEVDPDEVEIGSIIVVRPGEKIPIDGFVIDGEGALDTAALTGESVPRSTKPGDRVISGCISINAVLRIRTEKEYEDSTVARVLEMIEDASSRKAQSEKFISRFARIYTPVVVGAAVALALCPPLIRMVMGLAPLWGTWLYRALIFLVISCPCALVVSIPLSFFAGIGGASRKGVLVKGANYLEFLSEADTIVFDKTGTLTEGVFRVTKVVPAGAQSPANQFVDSAAAGNDGKEAAAAGAANADHGRARTRLLHLAAAAEQYSTHPIATSLRTACEAGGAVAAAGADTFDMAPAPGPGGAAGVIPAATEVEEISGHGVKALIEGQRVYVGNARLMKAAGIEGFCGEPGFGANGSGEAESGWQSGDVRTVEGFVQEETGTVIHVAAKGEYLGYIVISDVVKEHSREAIAAIRREGVGSTVMLTGDRRSTAEKVAKELGIDQFFSDLLPQDKVTRIEEMMERSTGKRKVAFVGDGINDAPVLSRADIGIAMGAMGSDAAVEAADIVLMDDDPLRIATAIRISRKCMRIVKQNIWFAIGVKVLCLLLGAVGIANMWLAIFADVGVMILAVLNAIRCMFIK